MPMTITKPGIDIGIVTRDADAMLEFYRDVVGLKFLFTVALEELGIARMDMLACNDTVVKLVTTVADVPDGPDGGLEGSSGIRYMTMTVDNLDAALADCEAAGANIVWPRKDLSVGVSVGLVEDPDGNWLEFIQG